jgi:two-component system sensor histidine kinase GlrK
MRVATKIIYGFGILIALMAALVAFQVVMINRMQDIIQNLSGVNFQVASSALQLYGAMTQIDGYARKAFELGDPDYDKEFRSLQDQIEQEIAALRRQAKSQRETAEIDRLASFWNGFVQEFHKQKDALPPGKLVDFPKTLFDSLQQMETQTYNVYVVSSEVIQSETKRSLRTGRDVKMLSGTAAAIALVLSLLVWFLIVQSISVPLKYLTQGTRAIAEGKFFYRLDTSHKDEFSQVAKDFNAMSERLNELDQMKKDFVSHVSHELKAPLASMQETIQLMLDQIPGKLTQKQRKLLELNRQSGKRLSAMISNLLDLSRMEAGVMEYELESNDLVALIRSAVDETEPLAQEKGIHMLTEIPQDGLTLSCDADRIVQVIKNLLGNAVKFSPGKGEILVRLVSTPELPQGVPESCREKLAHAACREGYGLISVTDSGPGVPDPHKEKIFEKFHQVKQGKKMPGQGAGLGLAISRTICEAHQGAVWVEDNPPGGSVFKLLLPLSTPSQEAARTVSPPI